MSSSDKATVMKNKKLASTKIFINNDLTKEQAREDKRQWDIKNRMLQDESYHGKKISIYEGKIYVNRQLADHTSLQAFDQACYEFGQDDATALTISTWNINGLTANK